MTEQTNSNEVEVTTFDGFTSEEMSTLAEEYITADYSNPNELYTQPCQNRYCNRQSNALIIISTKQYIYCFRCLYHADKKHNILFNPQIEHYYMCE